MAKGYILVQVSVALQSLPLENARVEIYAHNGEERELISSVLTDPEGKTQRFEVDAPDISFSETPDNGTVPYSLFDIFITYDGFYSVAVRDMQVFAERTSVQYVNMIPLPEGVSEGENIIVVNPQNL